MFCTILFIVFVLLLLLIIRLWYIVRCTSSSPKKRNVRAKTLIILGSGGHTAEMMALVKELNKENYSPRFYVLASSDTTSESKVLAFEADAPTSSKQSNYEIIRIDRSRHVGQSYYSAIFTTIWSTLQCIPLMYKLQPDLVLCNGPGTCVPICLIALLMKVLYINTQCKIIFIESFCRVKTISLSGKILVWFVDCFVVQWPQLTEFSTKAKYFGRLT